MNAPLNNHGLFDIYTTRHIPFWETRWFFVCAVALATLVCAGLIFYGVRWYRRRKERAALPWEWALRELAVLRKKKTTPALFYADMTFVLKQYVHKRYGINMPSKTDDEMIRALKEAHFDDRYVAVFKEIARDAVGAKFAKSTVSDEQMMRHYAFSVTFIQETTTPEQERRN